MSAASGNILHVILLYGVLHASKLGRLVYLILLFSFMFLCFLKHPLLCYEEWNGGKLHDGSVVVRFLLEENVAAETKNPN